MLPFMLLIEFIISAIIYAKCEEIIKNIIVK